MTLSILVMSKLAINNANAIFSQAPRAVTLLENIANSSDKILEYVPMGGTVEIFTATLLVNLIRYSRNNVLRRLCQN